MPSIILEGPIIKDVEKKRELVKELTKVVSKFYGLPEKAIVVLIKENPPENVGVGGELVIDRLKAKSD